MALRLAIRLDVVHRFRQVRGVSWQGTHTQRFDGRHELFGHLFQGRCQAAVVVEKVVTQNGAWIAYKILAGKDS
jgi:hypothetical protein